MEKISEIVSNNPMNKDEIKDKINSIIDYGDTLIISICAKKDILEEPHYTVFLLAHNVKSYVVLENSVEAIMNELNRYFE